MKYNPKTLPVAKRCEWILAGPRPSGITTEQHEDLHRMLGKFPFEYFEDLKPKGIEYFDRLVVAENRLLDCFFQSHRHMWLLLMLRQSFVDPSVALPHLIKSIFWTAAAIMSLLFLSVLFTFAACAARTIHDAESFRYDNLPKSLYLRRHCSKDPFEREKLLFFGELETKHETFQVGGEK